MNPGPLPAEHSQRKDREAARLAKGLPAKTKVQVIDDGEWLSLPREGRGGNPPAWPLTKASTREYQLWRRLWKLPQALAWERVSVEINVAVHVRTLVRAEDPDSKIGLTNTLRLQQDGLGLSPIGLRALRWKIGKTVATVVEPVTPSHPAPGLSPKERMKFRLVGDGDGG